MLGGVLAVAIGSNQAQAQRREARAMNTPAVTTVGEVPYDLEINWEGETITVAAHLLWPEGQGSTCTYLHLAFRSVPTHGSECAREVEIAAMVGQLEDLITRHTGYQPVQRARREFLVARPYRGHGEHPNDNGQALVASEFAAALTRGTEEEHP